MQGRLADADLNEQDDLTTLPLLPVELQWKLVRFLTETGSVERAAAALNEIEATRGSSVRMLEHRAALAAAQGNTDQALRWLEERIALHPSVTASVHLARHHLEHGNLGEAEAISEELQASAPEQMQVRSLVADVAWARGDLETARSYFEAEIKRTPDNETALIALAAFLVECGEASDALINADRAAAANDGLPTETQSRKLADLFQRLGHKDRAIALRQRAAQLWDERQSAFLNEVQAATANIVPAEPAELVLPQLLVEAGNKNGRKGEFDPKVLEILQRDFGHDDLRPGQVRVIEQVLAGQDTLAIMPTGAGKSLTFQLPAMLMPGITLVISPLIALMKDQLESLPSPVQSRSLLINSSIGLDEIQARIARVQRGEIKLVYIAPERFRDHLFLRALQPVQISLAVIDEAHCINLWGSDFRPDYLFIPKALAELGDPPVLAVTATATPAMARQIGAGLGRDLEQVRNSLFRPNLHYEVHLLKNREQKIAKLIEICQREQGSGIVYVSSRKDAESLAGTLRDRGVMAVPYHAGLDKEIRSINQERFMSGRSRVVVATVAFGMGIDKADVRFIVHFAPPDSLEAYAQESGRAGRDGNAARCALLATASDGTRLKNFARREEMKIETLRAVYGALKRFASGNWVVVDGRNIELAVMPKDEVEGMLDDRVDIRVALGFLEQAGIIVRQPDAPISYSIAPRSEIRTNGNVGSGSPVDIWLSGREDVGTVSTAEVCSASGVTPFELDRLLYERMDLAVRSGPRGIAVQLLTPPAGIAQRMESLLAGARQNADRRIDQIIAYINGRQCRHSILAAHLGERLEACGNACDVCRRVRGSEFEVRSTNDVPGGAVERRRVTTADALVVLKAVAALPFQMGKTGLTKLLLGSVESKVRADRSAQFGALREVSKGTIEKLIDRLAEDGLLYRDLHHEYKIITVTARGKAATEADLIAYASPGPIRVPNELASGSVEEARYRRLTAWRTKQMHADQVPGFVIASNAVLRAIATSGPKTVDELRTIPGFGQSRVQKYGEEILEALYEELA